MSRVTERQAIIGVGGKVSVAITEFTEAPICIAGFATWFVLRGLPRLDLMLVKLLSAVQSSPGAGGLNTYKLPIKKPKFDTGHCHTHPGCDVSAETAQSVRKGGCFLLQAAKGRRMAIRRNSYPQRGGIC